MSDNLQNALATLGAIIDAKFDALGAQVDALGQNYVVIERKLDDLLASADALVIASTPDDAGSEVDLDTPAPMVGGDGLTKALEPESIEARQKAVRESMQTIDNPGPLTEGLPVPPPPPPPPPSDSIPEAAPECDRGAIWEDADGLWRTGPGDELANEGDYANGVKWNPEKHAANKARKANGDWKASRSKKAHTPAAVEAPKDWFVELIATTSRLNLSPDQIAKACKAVGVESGTLAGFATLAPAEIGPAAQRACELLNKA